MREVLGVHLQLLGGFACIHAGRSVWLPLGSQRLLALLALRDGGVHRTVAGECLWPDSTVGRAAANLRSALWRGKRLGDNTVIESAGPRLHLASTVGVDLRQLLDQHRKPAHSQSSCHGISDHLGLVDALTCQLLPEWADDWLLSERTRWDQFRLHALENLASQFQTEQRYLDALQTALAASAIDPIRETAHRIVVETHLAEGNTASAFRHYEYYRQFLHRELGVRPSARMDSVIGGLLESVTIKMAAISTTPTPPHKPCYPSRTD